MKWPIFFGGVVIAGAFFFCYWFMAPARTKVPAQQSVSVSISAIRPIAASARPQASIKLEAPALAKDQTFTNDRRRILDSRDIFRTIEDVRRNGSPDEKDWAMSLLSSCGLLFAELPQISPEMAAAQPQFQASSPDSKELAEQKKIASEDLRERCRGIRSLNAAERSALKDGLKVRQEERTSVLGQLNAITDGPPGLWNQAQAKLLDESLYSEDPVVAKAAFFALLHGIDWNAPGGKERQSALIMALGDRLSNGTQTQFEALQDCRILERCGANSFAAIDEPALSAAVIALQSEYRAAWTAHKSAREILAIR